jgi:hypothetical protein
MAWSWLQSCISPDSGAAGSCTATFTTQNLSSGSTLIAFVAVPSSAGALGTCSSVKDGAGNSFVKIGENSQGAAGGGVDGSIWALNTPAGDAGTKPAITATASDSACTPAVLVQEVSGIATGNTAGQLADGSMGWLGGTAAGSSGPPSYGSSASSEYLVYFYVDDGFGTANTPPGSPWTADPDNRSGSTNSDVSVAYKNSTGTTETGTWTTPAAGTDWGLGMIAFLLGATITSGPLPGLQALVQAPVVTPVTSGWRGAAHSR